jgi:nucleoside 2-deoxyribosyltransferase
MANQQKNILLRNTQTNKVTSFGIEEYKFMMKNLPKGLWLSEGYERPDDILTCWYVTEKERISALKDKRPFSDSFVSTEYFKITKRIDTTFIEGHLGRSDDNMLFHDNYNFSKLIYYSAYKERKKVYFSFDKIALYEVMEIIPESPLRFILKRIDNNKSFVRNQAFMIMPFHNKDLDKIYFDSIRPFLKDTLAIDVYRADDFRDNDIIIETIHKLIEESEFIIAETTKDNKNSFYELGYASAIGKEIIIIQNKNEEQKLFFDRAHIRAIMYDPNDLETFQFDLKSTIASIRNRQ